MRAVEETNDPRSVAWIVAWIIRASKEEEGLGLQGVLFGMKPYKMLVLPICMAKQVKFVEFRPNEDFSSICVFFYISMSNF